MTFEYNLQIGLLKNVKHIYRYMGFYRGIADDALPHAHSILYTWGGLEILAPDI
jgi:hypothetical protein